MDKRENHKDEAEPIITRKTIREKHLWPFIHIYTHIRVLQISCWPSWWFHVRSLIVVALLLWSYGEFEEYYYIGIYMHATLRNVQCQSQRHRREGFLLWFWTACALYEMNTFCGLHWGDHIVWFWCLHYVLRHNYALEIFLQLIGCTIWGKRLKKKNLLRDYINIDSKHRRNKKYNKKTCCIVNFNLNIIIHIYGVQIKQYCSEKLLWTLIWTTISFVWVFLNI